ncbi:DDE-type integrase/transposase/recombinase [Pacificibacter marinus]|nr:DDE-type integrase/transposase/recombinase [Pacificibacter marinus]
MKRDLAIRALNMAIAFRKPPKGCIDHTDRGSQYCSHDYQKILRKHGFKISMSGKGNCYEFKLVRASGLNDLGDHSKAQNAAVLRRENSLPDCFLILLTFFKTPAGQ